jgi:hypothetical protein
MDESNGTCNKRFAALGTSVGLAQVTVHHYPAFQMRLMTVPKSTRVIFIEFVRPNDFNLALTFLDPARRHIPAVSFLTASQ